MSQKIFDTPIPHPHIGRINTLVDQYIQENNANLPVPAKEGLKSILIAGAQIGFNMREEIKWQNGIDEIKKQNQAPDLETQQPKKNKRN